MPKLDDAITYEIFKILAKDPNSTQRALAKSLGVSLGKLNYCLKALIAKGWIKAKNFEQSNNKSAYAYILTPSGLESKARVTARFLRRKIAEYEKLQIEIESMRREVAPDENVTPYL